MPLRHQYLLTLPLNADDLPLADVPGAVVRNPTPDDVGSLAELMLDAYLSTIDYDGETMVEALAETDALFYGGSGELLPSCSWVVVAAEGMLAASLATRWQGQPLIAYVLTRAVHKKRGLGKMVLHRSLLTLQEQGESQVRAFITEGNTPSERLFARFGFVRI